MARLTQAKIDKAVKAVADACGGAAQVVIEPDGTVRVLPALPGQASPPQLVHKGPIRL
jgi:hypothetical protein